MNIITIVINSNKMALSNRRMGYLGDNKSPTPGGIQTKAGGSLIGNIAKETKAFGRHLLSFHLLLRFYSSTPEVSLGGCNV